MGRVLFGMIDNRTRPIGGVKVIYQAVGGLRRRGFDAFVASGVELPEWLAGSKALDDVAILDMSRKQELTPADLYVATDAVGPHRMPLLLSRPERRVLYIQNHNALTANNTIDWSRLTHIRCLTVSEYSRRHLIDIGGFREVAVVPPGVDLSVFRPGPGPRRHRIAYMPRKLPNIAKFIRNRLGTSVEWLPIHQASEAETAEILAGSSIFLNFGHREGFGLPPLEAMAAGCIVCGFAGEGTSDFATPENGFWAEEGDVEGCLHAIEQAVAAVADPEQARRVVDAGRRTAERYSLTVFEDAMAAYIKALL